MSSHAPAPASGSPAEGAAELELQEERRVTGSPHAMAAGAAVLALTRAARSFTLYDPANKVVHSLIAGFRDRFLSVLREHGALTLEVHPFELLLGREVVYLEHDRERSLAFRLFRDGVRRLSFDSDASWDELLRLLQILSIRYTGVRQQEDDLVTLLRKAGFARVHVAAIEGFVPEEEQSERALDAGLLRGARVRHDAPPQWDTPLPSFGQSAPLAHRTLPEGLLARLRAEEDEARVPEQAVQAVAELLRLGGTQDLPDVVSFAFEVRECLLVEGRADLLVALASRLRDALGPATEAWTRFLDSWLDERTLTALVAAAAGQSELAGPLAQLVDQAQAPVVDRLFALLASEGDGPRAPVLRQLLASACRHAPQGLVARLRGASGPAATALFRLLESADPQAAQREAAEATTRGDPTLQREALRLFASLPFTPEVARSLHHLIESAHEGVRLAALPVMAARGGPRVFSALRAHVDKHAARLGLMEADAAGLALVRSSPSEALETFEAWLHPKSGGLLGRLVKVHAPLPLQRVALAGLRSLPGPRADGLLELLADHGDASLREEAETALEAREAPPGSGRG